MMNGKKLVGAATALFGINAFYAVVLAQNTSQLEAVSAAYKKIIATPPETSKIQEVDGYIFAISTKPYSSSSYKIDQIWSTQNIAHLLFDYCSQKYRNELSPEYSVILKNVPGNLKVSGKRMMSGKLKDNFVTIYAVKKSDFEAACKRPTILNHLSLAEVEIKKSPQNFLKTTEKIFPDEIAALSKLSGAKTEKTNVFVPSAGINSNKQSLTPEETIKSIFGSEKQLNEFLSEKKIALLKCDYSSPVLKRVEDRQGFVIFEDGFSSNADRHLREVKKFFQQGRDLDAAVLLLEAAAESAPRNPEVWEYLEAAYRSKGDLDKAHLANRVWFLLAKDKTEPLKKLTNYLPKTKISKN